MKKRLVSLIALIISLVVIMTAVSGCNLVSVNNEKDLDQVVATIQIDPSAPKDEIKKKELAMSYLNYGYYYVQTGEYTEEEVYKLILETLIQSRIFIQVGMIEFGAKTLNKWSAVDYLDDKEKIEAEYDTIKSINDMIDSYEEVENLKQDTLGETVRTVPTDATNNAEKTFEEKDAYVKLYKDKGANLGTPGSERYKGYNKFLKILEVNGLLGEDVETIKDSNYYKDSLKSKYEAKLIEKYENKIKDDAIKAVSYDNLKAEYEAMYNATVNSYKDANAFSSALSGASAQSPVIYTPYTGYVYVYNLLLGASESQTALIGKLDKEELGEEGYALARKAILDSTTVKDLRSTWLYSGYDFDATSNKFTGDYTFTSSENSLPFQGEVEVLKEKTETENAVYKVSALTEYALSDFIDFMDTYMYGEVKENNVASSSLNGDVNVFKLVNEPTKVSEYDEKINELLFAFSTDAGSLNTYKGYVVSPKPDIGGAETYVDEFAKAGRAYVEDGLNGSSYIVMATDYGYHVMFFSELVSADANYATLDAYLDSLGYDKGSATTWAEYLEVLKTEWEDFEDADFYLYDLLTLYANADSVLSDYRVKMFNQYAYDSTKVVKYPERYSNLISTNANK